MDLKLKLVTPVVFDSLQMRQSADVVDSVSDAKFEFSHIHESSHSHGHEYLIKYGDNVQKLLNLPETALLPGSAAFRVPLLKLLLPQHDTFEYDLSKVKMVYELEVYGNSSRQRQNFLFISNSVPLEFDFQVGNFDPEICDKLNRISKIQLQQLKELSQLLQFGYSDRFIDYLNYLLDLIPGSQDGCLVHWTFAQLESIVKKLLDIDDVLYVIKYYSADYGYELMPLNWALVTKS